MESRYQKVSRYFFLFMIVSFLGWLVETVFFFILYGDFYDRGFMTLPFCTIYGCALFMVDALIGIPGKGSGVLLIWEQNRPWKVPVYVLLSAIIPVGLELVTGYFFDRILGLRLWDYSACRFHFRGYICLEYALLWSVLVPLCMRCVYAPLKKWVFGLNVSYTGIGSVVLGLCACFDWGNKFLV